MNDRGQLAVKLPLQGAVTADDDIGIWAQDHTGALQLIARKGQMIEVAPGDTRQVASLELGDINKLGQIAFHATFVGGGYGVFVSSQVALTPGDYDGDGSVATDDFALWKSTFGSAVDLLADGNGNGIVDAADYTVWRNHLSSTGPGSGAVACPSRPAHFHSASLLCWRS